MENNKTVFIDIDSVTSDNNSIYYNVKYYGKNGEEISRVQSTLNETSTKSFLYNANEIAKFTNFRKTHKSINVVSNNTENKKQGDYISDEYNKSFTRPFSANTGKIDTSKENQLVLFSKPYNRDTNKVETGELAKSFEVYQNKLYQAWTRLLPKGAYNKKTVVLITFYKNGELISCILKKSSGDDETDEAAIKAVRQVGNFVEIPKDYKDDYLDINFTFSYRGIIVN